MDHLPKHRRYRKRAAFSRKLSRAGLNKQVCQTSIGRDLIAVKNAAGNPESAVRRNDPDPAFRGARHRAVEREDQLTLRVLMLVPLGFIVSEVHSERHRRPMREAKIYGGAAGWLHQRLA